MDDSQTFAGWWFSLFLDWLLCQRIPMPWLAFAQSLIYIAAFVAPSVFLVKSAIAKGQKMAEMPFGQTETRPTAESLPSAIVGVQEDAFDSQQMSCGLSSDAMPRRTESPLASFVSLQDWQQHWKAHEQSSQSGSPTSVLELAAAPYANNPDTCSAAAHTAASIAATLDGATTRTVLHATPFGHSILPSNGSCTSCNAIDSVEQHLEPATPTLYISTSSRHLGVHRHTSKGSTTLCGTSGLLAGSVDKSPVPLPSPADSPLARRVTNDRDENGYPTCPALVELLQQHSSTSDESLYDGHEDEQSAPWAGLQLRSVSQQLPEDVSSNATSPPWLPLLMSLRPVTMQAAASKKRSSSGVDTASSSAAAGGLQGAGRLPFAQLVALHRAVSGSSKLVDLGSAAGKHHDCSVPVVHAGAA